MKDASFHEHLLSTNTSRQDIHSELNRTGQDGTGQRRETTQQHDNLRDKNTNERTRTLTGSAKLLLFFVFGFFSFFLHYDAPTAAGLSLFAQEGKTAASWSLQVLRA